MITTFKLPSEAMASFREQINIKKKVYFILFASSKSYAIVAKTALLQDKNGGLFVATTATNTQGKRALTLNHFISNVNNRRKLKYLLKELFKIETSTLGQSNENLLNDHKYKIKHPYRLSQ